MNRYAGGRGLCDIFLQSPPVKNEAAYIDFIREAVRLNEIPYVFLLSDVEIIFYNTHRDAFAGLPAKFAVNPQWIIDTFNDKIATVDFFKSKGIETPATFLPSQFKGQIPFPLILKRRQGSGSQQLFKVHDAEELQFYLKRHPHLIIQEYIEGDDQEYTAGIFNDGKNVYTITFRRLLAPGGFSGYVELATRPSIASFPVQVAHAIDLKEPFNINVQFRQTSRGCIPFEINPRFSSTVYFRHLFGYRDVMWTLDLWQGKPAVYKPLYESGIGVRTFGEVLFDLKNVN